MLDSLAVVSCAPVGTCDECDDKQCCLIVVLTEACCGIFVAYLAFNTLVQSSLTLATGESPGSVSNFEFQKLFVEKFQSRGFETAYDLLLLHKHSCVVVQFNVRC